MSSEQIGQFLNSKDLDRQYHKTVLKVPDTLGLVKGAVSREMYLTQRDLFEVKFFLWLKQRLMINLYYLLVSR